MRILAAQHDAAVDDPQPSDIYGQWSWTHHPDVKVWIEKSIADAQKEAGHFSDTPLRITEGWLKLIAARSCRDFTCSSRQGVTLRSRATWGQQFAPGAAPA